MANDAQQLDIHMQKRKKEKKKKKKQKTDFKFFTKIHSEQIINLNLKHKS